MSNRTLLILTGILLALILAGSLVLGAIGTWLFSTRQVSTTQSVTGFRYIELAGPGRMTVTQGESEGIAVDAPPSALRRLVIDVRGDTLYVGYRRGLVSRMAQPARIEYEVRVRDLRGLTLSGAGEIVADGVRTPALVIAVPGVGTVRAADLQTDKLEVTLEGAGTVEPSGRAAEQELLISGFGRYNAGELASERAIVNLTGAGSATLWVSDALAVNVSGAGHVDYYGDPEVDPSITGMGSVQALGAKQR